ncbi:MAG: hypothetical protein H6Q76_1644 [Firmicutes bacterium]|nr:hypothetical protein [Bacillota bacterium]
MKTRKALPFQNQTQGKVVPFEQQIRSFSKAVASETPRYTVGMERTDGTTLNFMVEQERSRCFLHSLYDTKREMKEMFQGVDREVQTLVIFGMGLGYAVEYAGENFPKLEKVFVVEPSSTMLTTLLRQPEVVRRLSKVPTVTFVWNKPAENVAGELAANIDENVKRKFEMVFHMSYRSLFKGYYETISEKIVEHLRQIQVNTSTVHSNIFFRTQNILHNLRARSVDIQRLLERIKGVPAIMVSAGPSLNKNIHLLEAAKRKAIIIPVGSAVKILHNKGIKPHLRAAFSPYPDENVVFDGIPDYEGIPLLYSNTLDYLVVQKYNAPKARMVMVGDLVSRYFYTLTGSQHTLVEGGGTIANVTFDLLCRAGCGKVIFTGQDLCLSGLKMYADGSWSDPTYTGQEAGLVKTEDIFGQTVFTTKPFYGLKTAFEQAIQQYPNVEILNATEGGVPLAGAKNVTLQEVLDSLPERPEIDELIRDAFAEEPDAAAAEARLDKTLEEAAEQIVQVLECNDRWYGQLQEMSAKGRGFSRVLSDLNELQRRHDDELAQNQLYGQLIRHELATHFSTIRLGHQYEGDDIEKKIDSTVQILVGQMQKIHEYAGFFKESLARSKGVK